MLLVAVIDTVLSVALVGLGVFLERKFGKEAEKVEGIAMAEVTKVTKKAMK